MEFSYINQTVSLQMGHCPYSVPSQLMHQMTVPNLTLAVGSGISPAMNHHSLPLSGPSVQQNFTPVSTCAELDNSSCPKLFVHEQFSATTVPVRSQTKIGMCSIQPEYSPHASSCVADPHTYRQQLCSISTPSQVPSTRALQYKHQCQAVYPAFHVDERPNSLEKPVIKPQNTKQPGSSRAHHNKNMKKVGEPTKITKGKSIKRARGVREGCSYMCQKRCKQKLSNQTRTELCSEFWSLKDDAERKLFIAHHAKKVPMMTCKEGSKRSMAIDWAFTVKGDSFSVCKRFFMHTLDISEDLAYSAVKESHCNGLASLKVKQQIKKGSPRHKAWIETDIDDYCAKKADICAKKQNRYDRKERIVEMKEGCTGVCRRGCQTKFTYDQRLAIFNGYRSLSNVRKQRDFLQNHVKRLQKKDRRMKEASRRGCSIQWLLYLNDESIPVCKTFFLHTVGISEYTAYNVGLQNQLLPVERNITTKKQKAPWKSLKSKYIKSMLAKDTTSPLLARLGKKLLLSAEKEFPLSDVSSPHMSSTCILECRQKKSDHDLLPTNSKLKTVELPSSSIFINTSQSDSNSIFSPSTFSSCHILQSQDLSFLSTDTSGLSSHSRQGFSLQPEECQCKLPVKSKRHDHLLEKGIPRLFNKTLKNTAGNLLSSCKVKPKLNQSHNSETKGASKCKRYTKKDPRERRFGKQLKSGCSDLCRKNCNKKIPHYVREELFDEFWQLESDVLRREFIIPIVNKIPKKSGKRSESRRSCTLEWTIPYDGDLHVVCKKFFLDTFDIRDNFVQTVHEKIEKNEGSMEDMRGRHGQKPAAFLLEEREAESYVKSRATYKAVRCNGCDKDFPQWCLDSNILIGQLYKDYANERKAVGMKPACRSSFTAMCSKRLKLKHTSIKEHYCDQCCNSKQDYPSKVQNKKNRCQAPI